MRVWGKELSRGRLMNYRNRWQFKANCLTRTSRLLLSFILCCAQIKILCLMTWIYIGTGLSFEGPSGTKLLRSTQNWRYIRFYAGVLQSSLYYSPVFYVTLLLGMLQAKRVVPYHTLCNLLADWIMRFTAADHDTSPTSTLFYGEGVSASGFVTEGRGGGFAIAPVYRLHLACQQAHWVDSPTSLGCVCKWTRFTINRK